MHHVTLARLIVTFDSLGKETNSRELGVSTM
jgi:hypothetical protein